MFRSALFPAVWLWAATLSATATLSAAASDAPAQPEALLSGDTLVYLRFDGIQPHREAAARTVLGELIRNELRPLVAAIAQLIGDAFGPDVLSERLLAGAEPDQLIELKKAADQLPRLLELVNRAGFVVGLEYTPGAERGGQAVVVFPRAGGERDRAAIFGALRLIGHLASAAVSEETVDDRRVLRVAGPDLEPFALACWREGEHVLLTAGTQGIEHTLDVVRGKRGNLTDSGLLKRCGGFDEYETYLRGFVDLAGVVERAQQEFPPAERLVDELGLTGLKSASLHLGFEGGHQRSTLQLDTPARRTGLLQVFSPPEPIGLDDLPPLPPDASALRSISLDVALTYQEILKALDVVFQVTSAESQLSATKAVAAFERGLAINLRKDLLARLGPRIVTYSSPSEGPFVFGMTLAIEIRDGAEAVETIKTLATALTRDAGTEASLDTRAYHGVDLHMLRISEQGFPLIPTFAVVDRWLVASLQPQPVQGFVLRARKGFSRWEPPQIAADVLGKVRERRPQARIAGLTVVDPRPTVASVASFAPMMVASIQSFSGGERFDTSLIPNGQALTEPLTHNVTVISDDGASVRIDTWASLPIPFQLTGMESYFALVVPQFLFLAF